MQLAVANQFFISIYSFDSLMFVQTQYNNIHDRAFHILTLWKRKVKIWFAADNTILTVNSNSLQTTQFRQWTLVRYRQHISTATVDSLYTTQFQQQTLIHSRKCNFSSKLWFSADNAISAANTGSLHTMQFRQWTLVCCTHHNFNSKLWFAPNNAILAANTSSLQTT